ncbi:hypothetical protein MANY_22330 [Mycolicibacterium anyangense]|jgi:hypothetical protein|uniref:Uncharacterized protein n=1 Tax=Mycolicibacterium anyangense TaxID=1431246 RepID=A0A6N4W4M8_9MYCO|nr:hypothetical protein MANY_22330 [Mycolicibacterium anyangense]
MWLVVLKVALVAFLAIGVGILIFAYARRAREIKSQRIGPDPDMGPSTTWGIVPPTPLPEWAYWDEAPSDLPPDPQDGRR